MSGDADSPENQPKTPEQLSQELAQASAPGRRLLDRALERQRDGSYSDPYVEAKNLPREYIAALQSPRDRPPTAEEVAAARKASIGIAVETAFQTLQSVPIDRRGNDSAASLYKLNDALKNAAGFVMMNETTHPDLLAEVVRESIARRSHVSPDQIDVSPEQLKLRGKNMLSNSIKKLTRAADD